MNKHNFFCGCYLYHYGSAEGGDVRISVCMCVPQSRVPTWPNEPTFRINVVQNFANACVDVLFINMDSKMS